MNSVQVANRTRTTSMGSRIRIADDFWSRLRGFLGRPRPNPGEGLLLTPCDAVHMFGMRFALDVVFLDGSGRVVHVEEELQPWRWTPRVEGAATVLELPAGTVRKTGTSVGDDVDIAWQGTEPVQPLAKRTS